MFLVRAEEADLVEPARTSEPSFAKWRHFPISILSDHGEACCATAREWVAAMDFAQLGGGDLLSGPRWLRARYEWGPSPWPMHWCDLVARKVIDCGAHAALAHHAFAARGVPVLRAQFIQRYCPDAEAQWRVKWGAEQVSDHWIGEGCIYHEGIAIIDGAGALKLWDASAGWWLNPRHVEGYGSLAAVRLFGTDPDESATLRWGPHRLRIGEWVDLAPDDGPKQAEPEERSLFFRRG